MCNLELFMLHKQQRHFRTRHVVHQNRSVEALCQVVDRHVVNKIADEPIDIYTILSTAPSEKFLPNVGEQTGWVVVQRIADCKRPSSVQHGVGQPVFVW